MSKVVAIIFTFWAIGSLYFTFAKPPKDEYLKYHLKSHSIRYHSTGSSAFRGGGFNFGK